jgi:thiamine biosynthesis lipoprotein
MTSACTDLRRARPLLGTVVEIAVGADDRARGHAAIDAAFAAVEQVHRLMCFHEADSDVSRLNREADHAPVAVHPWTFEVLAAAVEFRSVSAGLFDVTIAPHLQARGLLPRSFHRHARAYPGHLRRGANCNRMFVRHDVDARNKSGHDGRVSDAISLGPGCTVRFSSSDIRIDLGGIAKGFAVDRAAEVLRSRGIVRGLVNAGGDLSAFGAAHAVDLRDPRNAAALLGRIAVSDEAVASSASTMPGAAPSLIVDPRTGSASAALGATVLAPDCLTADALTKLVVLLGRDAAPVLARYGARALFAASDGGVHVTDDWPEVSGRAA